MRTIALPLLSLTALLFADVALAQRGRGRPEEIQNRVGCFFTSVDAPKADADLATVDLVRAASGAGQLAVLYLYDGSEPQPLREQFERTLFGNDTMGLYLRCFHCGRIDAAKAPSLQLKFGKQLPLFVVFGKDGKQVADAPMPGWKAGGSALQKALEKAANPVFKPSLEAVVKDYEDLLRDLEQLLGKRKQLQERQSHAGGDDAGGKRAELDRDLKALDDEQQKLEQKENEMLQKLHLPARDPKAERLGRPNFGGRGAGGGRPDGRGGADGKGGEGRGDGKAGGDARGGEGKGGEGRGEGKGGEAGKGRG